MPAHEAGVMHGQVAARQPPWLHPPEDPNTLVAALWPRNVARGTDGVVHVAGLPVTRLAAEHGTPAYVVDEDDFRSRAREFRDGFAPYSVFYAGKAFLSVGVARWLLEEGLHLDVCSAGELTVALRAGFPPARIALHGNNKSTAELRRALEVGVGRIVVDSVTEIDRLAALARELRTVAAVMVRVTVGVEAHTHGYIATAHEDQKFGLSISSGQALQAAGRVLASPQLQLLGLHSHIGSQIFDTAGFDVAARRLVRSHAAIARDLGYRCPELGLGGGFGIAYTTQDDPASPAQLAAGLTDIVARECAAAGVPVPHLSVEPGRAIAGPSTFTLYEVGTVKRVPLGSGTARTYVCVNGGMSDNIRTALYDADYSCTLASRSSSSPPVLCRVVGKHCESGDVVVKDEFLPGDIAPGDLLAVPGTGAYCRSMANNYNHLPRPCVVAVRDGGSRLLLRRETEDDLLRLDCDADAFDGS